MTSTSAWRIVALMIIVAVTGGCVTSGQLQVWEGDQPRTYCDVEFVGAPKVDNYAVEYALSICAKNAVSKGLTIADSDRHLLELDLTIPEPPCGEKWDHDLAEQQYRADKLTPKQYGYLVAHIDLNLASINQCRGS